MDNILPLFQALDPMFPIGAYTLSGGMETYTQKGLVHDQATLFAFLKAQLSILPYGDLGIAAKASEYGDFVLLDSICAAMKQPYEIRRGSEKLCARFLKAQAALFGYPDLDAYRAAISDRRCDGHYSVAIGLFIRDLEVKKDMALKLYCYNILSAMVNHAAKLVPIGQLAGQSVLYAAMELTPETVQKAMSASLDDLGVSGCGFDIRAMQHETLQGRLYIS